MQRQLPFVLAATNQGTMIVSRLDGRRTGPQCGIGVGFQILNTGECDAEEHALIVGALEHRRDRFGPGVVVIDCGANIGVCTTVWARAMTGWGDVIAIEAQPRLFYALCGNIALNNLFNANAFLGAVGEKSGHMRIPEPDYFLMGSLGSFELKPRADGTTEDIGQVINYNKPSTEIPLIAIDDLGLQRCDFIKFDVEGMEVEAMRGARQTIRSLRPMLFVERGKATDESIRAELSAMNYVYGDYAIGWLCQHKDDGPVKLWLPKGRPPVAAAA